MGKRSRKRDVGAAATRSPAVKTSARPIRPAGAPHAKPVGRKASRAEAPPAPWSPFPLVELCILAGLILLVVGFFWGGDKRGSLFILGFALVSMSAVELSVREHFAGFRSHTTLLSACLTLVPIIPLFLLTAIPQIGLLILGAVLFALAFFVLRAAFARRAGGLGFRA